MRKKFNITGSCSPDRHYMVNSEKRFAAIEDMIDAGEYFTINRARQYGKTTMLQTIQRRLSNKYLIIKTSFEGVGDDPFKSEYSFAKLFASLMVDELAFYKEKEEYISVWKDDSIVGLETLAKAISGFCQMYPRPVTLLIDEVDKSSNNQLFVSFIGMLRDLFLKRVDKGMNLTFHSVVLAGVYDVKNLKLKLRPEEERKYNSPWNIASDFNVDMTFHPDEIAQMLQDYENDNHTGMDIKAVSEEIYKYTFGYPFLVSKLCKMIDEELDKNWTIKGVQTATKETILEKNTLFTSLTKSLEDYPELKRFVYSISILGDVVTYNVNNPVMDFATMFSIIKYDTDRKVRIHNIIFEEVLNNYFIAEQSIADLGKLRFQFNYVKDGKLDMEMVICRFHDLMMEEYRESTVPFLEREGRLLFLTFLKPIINGTGFYYVEPQTRDNRRMDLVVTYGGEEFIIELKIWRGEKYEEDGKQQLSEYLKIRDLQKGYLVTFDFSKNKQYADPQWVEVNDKQIFEVIV